MTTGFRGVVFDVDGVLVDSPHERSWQVGLQQLMENEWSDIRDQTFWSPDAFSPQVYQTVMSGMPRHEGARAALEYFGVPDAKGRVREYGDRKQALIQQYIGNGDFYAYPDALRFVLAVKDTGLMVATASSSKNANAFLERTRLDDFCEKEGLSYDFVRDGYTILDILDANVSGRDFERGKPHPEIFLTAAEEMGTPPARTFVVEDAANGIHRPRRRAEWRPWAWRGPTTRSFWPKRRPTSWSRVSDRCPWRRSPRGACGEETPGEAVLAEARPVVRPYGQDQEEPAAALSSTF